MDRSTGRAVRAAASLQRTADQLDIATKLTSLTETPDRRWNEPHEAYRAVLEHMLDNPPSNGPSHLAALRTLGANAKLVAECKALAP